MIKPWTTKPSHEELFVERYERLLSWSLKVTGFDRATAEDIVQDVYVQFTLARPDLANIENIDGYLYRMLRNRQLSLIRRNAGRFVEDLSVIDYDSAAIGLRACDPRSAQNVHDQLHAVCSYACLRKETSKAGSVLILRFFHGYYPAEIGAIMGAPRETVNTWLNLA